MNRKFIILIPLFSILSMNVAQAKACFVSDPAWMSGHQSVEAALVARVGLMTANVTRERAITNALLVSAIRVHTRQQSMNAEREVTMEKSSQEALATTVTQQAMREKIVTAKEQYSYETGQGVSACDSVALFNDTTEAFKNAEDKARNDIKNTDNAPGKATSSGTAMKNRLKNKNVYDASVLFEGGDESKQNAVIEHLAGIPLDYPDQTVPGVDADMMIMRARRVEALRSVALSSLSFVKAMSQSSGHGDISTEGAQNNSGSNKSYNEVLDEILDKYAGGEKYQDWSVKLVGQSERGLLLELARIRSISLQLRQQQLEQQKRLSVIISTMLAVEAQGDL
jgi:hypothetical protein